MIPVPKEIIHKCSDFEFAQCCRSGVKFLN